MDPVRTPRCYTHFLSELAPLGVSIPTCRPGQWMVSVLGCPARIHVHQEPVNVTLFGHMVLADVIS